MSTNDSTVLAQPCGDACLNFFPHNGEPKGEFKQIGGLNTYVGTPPASKKAGEKFKKVLMYFPDVFGIHAFKNGQLVVDYFASQGYLTLAVDYFRGDSANMHRKDRHDKSNPNFNYDEWKEKHMSWVTENLPAWVSTVSKEFGGENVKFFCVGYCFGAPFVMNELAGDVCTAGAFAHPAFLNSQHFQSCKKPLLLSCAETDHTFPPDSRREAVNILASSTNKPRYQVQLHSGVEHGFALRGDMSDAWQRYCKEESASGIVRWFDHFCGQ